MESTTDSNEEHRFVQGCKLKTETHYKLKVNNYNQPKCELTQWGGCKEHFVDIFAYMDVKTSNFFFSFYISLCISSLSGATRERKRK